MISFLHAARPDATPRRLRKVLAATVTALLAAGSMTLVAAPAQAGLVYGIVGDFQFRADDADVEAGATITYFFPNAVPSLVIPESVELNGITYDVTAIGDSAFLDKTVGDLTIPDSVQSIGSYAFYHSGVTSLHLGSGLEVIGASAFAGSWPISNHSLGDVVIPDSVRNIGAFAFYEAGITSLDLGNGVQIIGSTAFRGNSFSSLTIPDSVTSIDYESFYGTGLTEVHIGSGLTHIAMNAFRDNTLTSLTIPDTVQSIGTAAFAGNTTMATLDLGAGVQILGDHVFQHGGYTTVDIPASVTSIGSYAFGNYGPWDDGTPLETVNFLGPAPTMTAAGEGGSLGSPEDLMVNFLARYGADQVSGGFTTPTWQGYTTAITVLPPSAPRNLTATPGNRQVTLRWDVPADDGGSAVTGYQVEFAEDGGPWSAPLTIPNTTNATFGVFTNGTEYRFRLTAVNAVGAGMGATVVAIPASVPGVPRNLTATTPGNGEVELSWDAPSDDGGSAVTGYRIEYSEAGGAWSAPFTVDGTSVTIALSDGIEYQFRVTAISAVGAGVGATVSATPVSVPGVPRNLTATTGNGAVELSWEAPSDDGGSAVTGYRVEFSTNGTSWTIWEPAVTDTHSTVSGLMNGFAYQFRVTAMNSVGVGMGATASATPATVPGAPDDLIAIRGDGQVELGWAAPASDGGSPITGFVVEYRFGSEAWTTFADDVSATQASVTGLNNGTTYQFRVAAENGLGTGAYSDVASMTPATGPGAPTGVTATAGVSEVALEWITPASDGGSEITHYVVEYRTGDAAWITFADDVTSTSTTVTGLANGTEYEFRVAAVNSVGTGNASATASATPVPPPPAAASGVTVYGGLLQALVSWERSPDDTDPSNPFDYTVIIVRGLDTFTCNSTDTFCVVTGLTAGEVTARVVASSSTGSSLPAMGSGNVRALTDVPATAPDDHGGVDLEVRDAVGRPASTVTAGQELMVTAIGFAPESTVDAFAYSTPQHLGAGTADVAGAAAFSVVLPSDLAAGTHHLTVFGLTGDGVDATASVTVQVADTDTPGTDNLGGGTSDDELSVTGADTGVIAAAITLLVVGLALVARRRIRSAV